MNLDEAFVCSLVRRQKIEPAIEAGITVSDFDGDYRKLFKFVLDYYANPKFKGGIPTARILERQFKFFSYHDVDESVEWLSEQLKERTTYNAIVQQLRNVTAAIDKKDIRAAQEAYLSGAMAIAARNGKAKYVDLTLNAEDRIEDYRNRKNGGEKGTPSGFAPLDKLTLGFLPGDFGYVLARTGKGKTWALLRMAKAAQDSGKRVLFIPPEMAGKVIGRRYDALKFKLPYSKFRRGELSGEEEERYYKQARYRNGDQSFFVGDAKLFDSGRITPLTLQAKIQELKIDAVFGDSVYMFQSDNNTGGWEKHVDVAENLKRVLLAENIFGVFSNQLNNEAEAREATIENQRYGNYGQYADIAIKVHQGSDERTNHQILMWVLKLREEDYPEHPFTLDWDFETMGIGEGDYEPEEKEEATY